MPRAFSDVPPFDRLFDGQDMVTAVAASCTVPSCRDGAQTCPMLRGTEAGEAFALDQCPTACRG